MAPFLRAVIVPLTFFESKTVATFFLHCSGRNDFFTPKSLLVIGRLC